MAGLPEDDCRDISRWTPPCNFRQLRDSQTREGSTLAETSTSVLHPLYAHQKFLVNLVERWFRDLSDRSIRRGSFRSVAELESSIWDYIEVSNENLCQFGWTSQPEKLLAKVPEARAAANYVQD